MHRLVQQHFYDMKEVDLNKFEYPNALTIDGSSTRSFHEVKSVELNVLSL